MRLSKTHAGISKWEISLLMIFLAIAGGTTVFYFFISSRDVKNAQEQHQWAVRIDTIIDDIAAELANAVFLESPFSGDSKECFFRRAYSGGLMEPSLVLQGFVFSENKLIHVVRSESIKPMNGSSGKEVDESPEDSVVPVETTDESNVIESSNYIHKPFKKFDNPLVSNVQCLNFKRLGPALLHLSLQVIPPGGKEKAILFERFICLRNQ